MAKQANPELLNDIKLIEISAGKVIASLMQKLAAKTPEELLTKLTDDIVKKIFAEQIIEKNASKIVLEAKKNDLLMEAEKVEILLNDLLTKKVYAYANLLNTYIANDVLINIPVFKSLSVFDRYYLTEKISSLNLVEFYKIYCEEIITGKNIFYKNCLSYIYEKSNEILLTSKEIRNDQVTFLFKSYMNVIGLEEKIIANVIARSSFNNTKIYIFPLKVIHEIEKFFKAAILKGFETGIKVDIKFINKIINTASQIFEVKFKDKLKHKLLRTKILVNIKSEYLQKAYLEIQSYTNTEPKLITIDSKDTLSTKEIILE
ncbi:MAG: hypothetical protein J0H68_03250 [Sphingobacteriia bacterium]|nr:hypothetical protein [Sphingobacteriia bacterium]